MKTSTTASNQQKKMYYIILFFPFSFDYEYEAPAGPGYHQPPVCGPWTPHHHEVAMFTPEVSRYPGHEGGFYHHMPTPTYDYFNNNEHQCEYRFINKEKIYDQCPHTDYGDAGYKMAVVDMVLSPAVPAPLHRGPPPVPVDQHNSSSKKQPEVQETIEKKPELKIPKNKIPTASRNSTTDKKDKPKMVREFKVFVLIVCHHLFNIYSRKIFALDRTPGASTVTPTRPHCGGGPPMPRARPSATLAASTRSCTAPHDPWT